MSKREDIIDAKQAAGRKYGLIYTRKCGWVDLGHANPQGALELWLKVQAGNDSAGSHHELAYSQMMGKPWFKVGVIHRYRVKSGLCESDLKTVALSIFMAVSLDFEGMQGNFVFRNLTDSSFSAEDLVSNLIGFYRAVEADKDYITLCEPVSKQEALYVWDKFGEVGQNKNRTFGPYLYPTSPTSRGGPMCVPLPDFLSTITSASPGELFSEVK
jgi:hypothetical protein